MRITGGQFRSRAIVAPKGTRTRPTSDRVREALFSVLSAQNAPIEGANVLDLFAGTGALSFESISRGAASATLVDVSPDALNCIATNAKALGIERNVRVLRGRAEAHIEKLSTQPAFHLIFLDPPYAEVKEASFSSLLLSVAALLSEDGVLILEHSSADEAPPVSGLSPSPTRIYGDTALTLYGRS